MANIVYYEDIQFPDNVYGYWGTNSELRLWHNGTNSYVFNYTTGSLNIGNSVTDGNTNFLGDDGSGGEETYFRVDGGDENVQFSHDILLYDNVNLKIGTDGDFQAYHNGSTTYLRNNTGTLEIRNQTSGASDVYFKTTTSSPSLDTFIILDGSAEQTQFTKNTEHQDNVKALFGTGSDMEIFHNGSQAYIENYTGEMNFTQHVNNGYMRFKCDDGSGGTASYMVINGSAENISINKNTVHPDSVATYWGDANDFYIQHNSTNTEIINSTGHLYISNYADDKQIIFQNDDGSGGVETYFYLDGLGGGSQPFTVFPDAAVLAMGSNHDTYIQHTGAHMKIDNYTGNFEISNQADDGDLSLRCDDGSGGSKTYIKLDGGIATTLVYTDLLMVNDGNDGKIKLGASQDLQIYHDGSNSFIQDLGTGGLYVRSSAYRCQSTTGENMIYAVPDSGVYIYHNNVKKFETTANGIEVVGKTDTDTLLIGSGATVTTILDEDNMASNSATALATQQSIKAYVDSSTTGVLTYQGTWNASTNSPTLSSGSGTPGYYYIVSVAGSTNLDGITDWAVGDWAVFSDQATDAWQKIDNTAVGNVSGSGVNNRLVLWSGTSTVDSDSDFYVDGDTLYTDNLGVSSDINLGGNINKTSGNLTIDVAGQLNLDSGNSEIHLKGSGTTFGKLFVSGSDFYINNPTQDEDIVFSGNDGGSNVTALTLDMSAAGAATFNSNITLLSRITFDYGGDHYLESGTNTWNFKNSSGSTALTINHSDQSSKFFGNVTIPSYIYHKDDPSNDTYFGFSGNDTFVVYTAGGSGLNIDSNRNVTLTGSITVGHDLKMPTNGEIDWNAGAVKLIGTADDIKLQGGSLSITGDGSNAATLEEHHDGAFDITTVGDFTIDAAGDIILDAAGDDIKLRVSGTEFGKFNNASSNLNIYSSIQDKDIVFWGNDNGASITALTLDMSDAGVATFNSNVLIPSGYVGRDDHNAIFFSTDNQIIIRVADTHRVKLNADGLLPYADSSYDLGSTSLRYSNIWVDNINGATPAVGADYLPLAGGTMTGNITLSGDTNIVLDTSVSSTQSSGTIIKIGSHMSSLVAGNIYYAGNSMGNLYWYGADADSSSTENMLALSVGTDADVDGMLLNGIYHKASHGLTVGEPIYLSTTSMAMTNTAPSGANDYVRVLGYALDSNHIYFCPDNTWVKISS